MRSSLLLAGSFFALSEAASFPIFPRKSNTTNGFNWVTTKPTRDLQYHDCGGGFQCARLEVPLDWSAPNKNSTAAIAIVKLPATVPEDHPSFGGSVLLNPGGPGGSGTQFAYTHGPLFQTILGPERNYEIIGFDPRGVNMTTPYGDCYKGNEFNRRLDQERDSGISNIDQDFSALAYRYATAEARSALCEEGGVDSIWGHMNTASVARDMVEIIDRIDELRWKNSSKTKPTDAEKPRLQYIGISYGSYLGNVFASMFPERVGRVMIDAVIDAEDWVKATWSTNLNDAEKIVDYFYEVCYESGEGCPLIKPSDNSGVDIKGRIDAFLEDLDTTPISFVYGGRMILITSLIVRQAIFQLLYNTLSSFEMLAYGLDALLAGNYTTFWGTVPNEGIDAVCKIGDNDELPAYTWTTDALIGIVCSDTSDDILDRNITFYDEVIDVSKEQSPTAGASLVAAIPIWCAGRKIRPPYAFTGPFKTPAADPNDPNAPAAPLLITSSRLDPITPLANAVATQKQHPGSSLVIQEAAGHGILAGPSQCTVEIIKEFFSTGKVPENGTVCEAVCTPTIPASNCSLPLQARDVDHLEIPRIDPSRWL